MNLNLCFLFFSVFFVSANSSKVLELTTQNISAVQSGSWMLELYAPWCGFCKRVEPIWEELAETVAPLVKVARIDADKYKGAALRFFISGFPTMFHIKDGQVRKFHQKSFAPKDLKEFALTGWSQVEPIAWWYSPFSITGYFIDAVGELVSLVDYYSKRWSEHLGYPLWSFFVALFASVMVITLLLTLIFDLFLRTVVSLFRGPKRPRTKSGAASQGNISAADNIKEHDSKSETLPNQPQQSTQQRKKAQTNKSEVD